MKKLLTLLVIATIASSASAVDHLWQGDVDDLWSTGNNWTDDVYSGADLGVPTASDNVTLLDAGANTPRVASAGAVANVVYLGKWGWDSTLDVDAAGTLTVSDMVLGFEDVTSSVVNDGQISMTGSTYLGFGTATFENNGTFTAGGLLLGDDAGSISTFENTGTMTINGWLYLSNVASNNPTVFNMRGGTVDITGKLEMAAAGRGHLNLNGGTITTAELGLNGDGGYTIDITEGTLVADGDHTVGMDYMIGAGLITAYRGAPGTGSVAEYNLGTDQTTLYATGTPTLVTWEGDEDDLWSTGDNWNSGAVPTTAQDANLLNDRTYTPRVAAAGAVANNLYLGAWGTDSSLTVDAAGTLAASGAMVVGNDTVASSVVNDGDISVAAAAYLHLGTATVENNGTFTSAGLVLGNDAGSISTFENTGTLNVDGWLYLSNVASNNPSVFNMDGGTAIITGKLEMAVGGSGHLNLHGGTMTAGDLGLNGDGSYTIDVSDGELIADGNHTNGLDYMASVGFITAYGGFPGLVEVAYDAGQDETTLSASVPVFTGESLFLGDSAVDDQWTNSLNWTAGVPDAGLQAAIANPVFGSISSAVIDAAGASAWTVYLGKWGHPGSLEIESAGTLSIWNHLILGDAPGATGTVVNAGSIVARLGINLRGAKATLENSGTITTRDFLLGDDPGTASTFINTGDVTVENWMYLSVTASNTPSVFNMNGGTVDITGRLEMAPGGAGHLNLHGGTITTVELGLNGDGNYTIDVGDGVLVATGDHTGGMDWMISVGLITAYGGYPGAVATAVYNAGSNQTTLSATGGPLADYDAWDAGWIEDLSDREADYEGDGLINLLEYAYGGDPLSDDAATVSPTIEVAADVLTHVHRRRTQAYNTGELTYVVEVTGDLVIGPWYDPSLLGGTETVGDTADPNIVAVTNSIPVAGIDAGFVNLEVTEN